LIIINDGSSDKSSSVIADFRDSRIRYFEQENIGLAATLNRGISVARSAIIARQDNDDISLSERFERQFSFLQEHPEIALVGSAAEIHQ